MKLSKSLIYMLIFLLSLFIPVNIYAADDVIKGCRNSPLTISVSGTGNKNDTFTFECQDNCGFRYKYVSESYIEIGSYVRYSKNYELVFPIAGEHNISAFKNGVLSSRAKILIASDHSYGAMEIVEKQTCTKDGTGRYTCSNCKHSYTEKIPATGHSYTEKITKKETCTENGVKTYTCTNCNNSYTEKIPAIGHDYIRKSTKKPTCTEDGANVYTCSNCNNIYTEKIPATGHSYSKIKSSYPTCTKSGSEDHICLNCGKHYEKILPPTGHTYSGWTIIKKSTIFNKGIKRHVCLKCNAKETIETPKIPTKVSLSKKTVHMKVGKQLNLKIRSQTKGDKISSWRSSKNNIVAINKKTGKIKALHSGTATITLQMKSGCTATCTIRVWDRIIKLPEKNPNSRYILSY